MNEKKTQSRFEIQQVLNQPYKYGFETKIETEKLSDKQKPLIHYDYLYLENK
jgi:hypothetical protein